MILTGQYRHTRPNLGGQANKMSCNDRRAKIMQAAEKLFTSRSLHEITLDDVVAEAHVGKGTIYTYFASKEDLFFQVATSGFDDLCDLIDEKIPTGGPFMAQLISVCNLVSQFFARRKQLFRMIQSEGDRMQLAKGTIRKKWLDQRRRLVDAMARIIEKGIDEGEVRQDIRADILAGFLLGMLRTRQRNLAYMPKSLITTELIVELFFKGASCSCDGAAGRPEKKAIVFESQISGGRGV